MTAEALGHNYAVLKDNIVHYQPAAGRILQVAELLGFKELPNDVEGIFSWEGGLLLHSVHTAMIMMRLHRVLDKDCSLMLPYSVMLVGLLHDVGKCGVEKYPYFESTRDGDGWRLTRLAESRGHVDLALSLFGSAGVPLNGDERDAIQCHKGDAEFFSGGFEGHPLAALLHFANRWSKMGHDLCVEYNPKMAAGKHS